MLLFLGRSFMTMKIVRNLTEIFKQMQDFRWMRIESQKSLYTNSKLVYNSFDLETGGEKKEIIRIQNNEAKVEVNVFNKLRIGL